MITEDYYGFSDLKPSEQLKLEHNSRIKPKPQLFSATAKTRSVIRSLKRTELSNEKPNYKPNTNTKKAVSPKQGHFHQNRQVQSGLKVVPSQNELSLSNRQQIQMMVKKYDSYKYADSYWFKGNQTSRDNKSNCLPEQQGRNRFRREIKKSELESVDRYQQLQKGGRQEKVSRNYCSCSADKRQDYLTRFQRGCANHQNAADGFKVRAVAGLLRQSKSLGVLPALKHKMHTYYNAEKRRYYDYDESGYMTQRHAHLVNQIEKRSLEAFDRAFPQHKAKMGQKQSKNFEVEENSKLEHRNSGILGNLREEFDLVPNNDSVKILDSSLDKRLGEHKYEESANILIDSRKSSKLANDYQMSASSFKRPQEKQQTIGLIERKDIFNNFAKASSLSQDSLLQFKPRKAYEQNRLLEESIRRSVIGEGPTETNQIQINSNCKPQQEIEVPKFFQIDILNSNSGALRKNMSSQNDRNSNTSQSNSRSSSQQISSSRYSDLGSKTISLQSKKLSNASSQKDSCSNMLNFSKKKIKKQSESLSEGLEDSNPRELKDTAKFNPIFKHFEPQPVSQELLVESYKFQPEEQAKSILSNKMEVQTAKFRIQNGAQKQINSNRSASSNAEGQTLQQSQYNGMKLFNIPLGPINEKGSRFQNEAESCNEQSANQVLFKAKKQGSLLNSKQKATGSSQQQKQQATLVQQQTRRQYQDSPQQWQLFHQLQLLLQFQDNKLLLAQNMLNSRSGELSEVLKKIDVYSNVMGWMECLVSSVGEVYELQSVYHADNHWLLLSIFLTLKKCFYERGRVLGTLSGGKNCFKSLNCIIQDNILKKYVDSVQIVRIMNHMRQCNGRLQELIKSFHQQLVQIDSSYANHPTINLLPFSNSEQVYVLLSYFDQQIDILLLMREDQLTKMQVAHSSEEQLVVAKIDERIFRLMEMGFIMSSLSGRPIKAVEYEEHPYSSPKQFKNYLFDNHQQFKEVIKYFK